MPNLVTFGCSFAYGHGLPDCVADDGIGPGNKPSNLVWAKLLADKMGLVNLNYSKPGSGNKEILTRIINTDFQPDDTVIVSWSHFNRYDFFTFESERSGNRIQGYRVIQGPERKDIVMKQDVSNDAWILNNRINNWLLIHYANLYLNSKNIKNYHFLAIHATNSYPKPNLPFTNFFDIFPNDWIVDKALDVKNPGAGHPGLESQQILTEILYNKIHELY